MSVYDYAFAGLGSLCAFLAYKTNPLKSSTEAPAEFTKFQRNYIFVFLVMMMSDWLQGPYVYALYQYYNYSKEDIGRLFIAGFGSSMVFGTMVGSFGDSIGRRKTCILFGFLYIASCITKHFSNYYILMLGRLLGGVATSLLFSVFEAWMVSEHFSRGFEPSLLGGTFSLAYFGNSIVAIIAGLVGGFAADNFGLVAPFDCSAVMLVIGTFVVSTTWNENYGDASKPFMEQLQKGFNVVISQKEVAIAGAAQSMFEGAMYTFVFMWTPALGQAAKDAGMGDIPHGYIFAIFMVSCMIGSCMFKYLSNNSADPKMLLTGVICVAALGLTPAAIGGMGFVAQFAGFCLFEGSVGFYWPLIGDIRSAVIPEDTRSTIMNFFRVPLNLIVVIVLYHIGDLTQVFVFRFCVCLLCMATYLATILHIPAKTKQADMEKFEASG